MEQEFRPMRRGKQALTLEECYEVLSEAPRGVLALHGEGGYPYAVPLDHVWLDGKLYFHCAGEGHKIDAVTADSRVCYNVLDEGFRKEGEWALRFRSVTVFGRVRALEDPQEIRRTLTALALKFFPDPEEGYAEVEKYLDRVVMLELTPDHITGKRVKES